MLKSASLLPQTDIKGLKTEQKCLESSDVYFYQDDKFHLRNGSKILSLRENDKGRIRQNQHASRS